MTAAATTTPGTTSVPAPLAFEGEVDGKAECEWPAMLAEPDVLEDSDAKGVKDPMFIPAIEEGMVLGTDDVLGARMSCVSTAVVVIGVTRGGEASLLVVLGEAESDGRTVLVALVSEALTVTLDASEALPVTLGASELLASVADTADEVPLPSCRAWRAMEDAGVSCLLGGWTYPLTQGGGGLQPALEAGWGGGERTWTRWVFMGLGATGATMRAATFRYCSSFVCLQPCRGGRRRSGKQNKLVEVMHGL